MKHPWFRPWGWWYWPKTWQGWIVTLTADLFCVHVFIAVSRGAHSVSDTFYGIFPYVVPAAIVWYLIASKSSGER